MPVNLFVRINGIERAIRTFDQYGDSLRYVQNTRLSLRSRVPYAFGIETGYHRSGRLARRAGGAWYFRTAAQVVGPLVEREVVMAWPQGPQRVRQAWDGLIRKAANVAATVVPVVSGRLRGSIEGYAGRRRVV